MSRTNKHPTDTKKKTPKLENRRCQNVSK